MDRTSLTQRVLLIYSGVLTGVLAIVLLSGFGGPPKTASFDQIEVKRINLVEPDGTIRLVISDKAKFPGLIVKGKEYAYDRQTAGMLFFNDEGTENGGLIFGGMKDPTGKVQSWGHLSFDQYMGDQVAVLEAAEEDGKRHSGIQFVDEPDIPMSDITGALMLPPAQREARLHQLFSKDTPQQRVYLGRRSDRSAALQLKDPQGRDRVVMSVSADGNPSLEFLDDQGKVMAQFPKEAR
jgi:hypothetical protein